MHLEFPFVFLKNLITTAAAGLLQFCICIRKIEFGGSLPVDLFHLHLRFLINNLLLIKQKLLPKFANPKMKEIET